MVSVPFKPAMLFVSPSGMPRISSFAYDAALAAAYSSRLSFEPSYPPAARMITTSTGRFSNAAIESAIILEEGYYAKTFSNGIEVWGRLRCNHFLPVTVLADLAKILVMQTWIFGDTTVWPLSGCHGIRGTQGCGREVAQKPTAFVPDFSLQYSCLLRKTPPLCRY